MQVRDFTYRLHNTAGDVQAEFIPANSDEAALSPRYYGMVSLDGRYIVIKEVNASNVKTYTVAYGTSGYATAWTGRAALDYYAWDKLLDAIGDA